LWIDPLDVRLGFDHDLTLEPPSPWAGAWQVDARIRTALEEHNMQIVGITATTFRLPSLRVGAGARPSKN